MLGREVTRLRRIFIPICLNQNKQKLAVKTCISKNILVSFLERHSSEILNMLIRGEWNMEEALAVRYEEGQEDGGEKKSKEILALIKKGYTAAAIKKHLLKQSRSVTA